MAEPTAMMPCPFCGEVPKLNNIGSGQCVRIYCVGANCAAYPYIQKFGNGDALNRTIAAWNTRTPPVSMDEVARLRAALEQIVQGIPRPVGKSWFPDERPSKHDRCTHGIWMYEPCENCLDAFIDSVLTKEPSQ